jgi:mRNA interferase MazF
VVRDEVWWAGTPGGDRPVVVLKRDPLADRVGAVVVAACMRTIRGLMSELDVDDGMPERCVVSLENLHTLRKDRFRQRITVLTTRVSGSCAGFSGRSRLPAALLSKRHQPGSPGAQRPCSPSPPVGA